MPARNRFLRTSRLANHPDRPLHLPNRHCHRQRRHQYLLPRFLNARLLPPRVRPSCNRFVHREQVVCQQGQDNSHHRSRRTASLLTASRHSRHNLRRHTGRRVLAIRSHRPRVRSHLRGIRRRALIPMVVVDIQRRGHRHHRLLQGTDNALRLRPVSMICLKTMAIVRPRHLVGQRPGVMSHCVLISMIRLTTSGNMAVVRPTTIHKPIVNMTTKIMKRTSLVAGAG